jgi:hypothetical protein
MDKRKRTNNDLVFLVSLGFHLFSPYLVCSTCLSKNWMPSATDPSESLADAAMLKIEFMRSLNLLPHLPS